MLDTIPEGYYAQFVNDISYRLMQKVCSLAPYFASPEPLHIYQKIGMVILDYLKDLRSDWFGSAHQLKQSFDRWHLSQMLPLAAASVAAPIAASAPAPQTSRQQEHQKRTELVMKTPVK